jgi:hypothetical protein
MRTVPDSGQFPKSASSFSKAISAGKGGQVYGHDWHVVMETSDFERAWAFCPRPGIVVTETEIRDDPILRELFDAWRAGDDATYRQFAAAPLEWTEDDPS